MHQEYIICLHKCFKTMQCVPLKDCHPASASVFAAESVVDCVLFLVFIIIKTIDFGSIEEWLINNKRLSYRRDSAQCDCRSPQPISL